MATKRRCLEALSLFALDPEVRDEMLVLRGHLGATSDMVTPVVDAMLREDVDDEVTSAALAFLINLATEAPRRVPEAIINSGAPDIVLKLVFSGRADVRAEAACLIALLVANPEYRRHMSLLTGRSGDQTFNICRALSTALVAKDSITDARAKTGAYDTRSAASAALVYLARFGGLSELAYAMAVGDQDMKLEAAAALAHVAADVNERDNVVGIPGLVANLVEMIVLANDTRSRLCSLSLYDMTSLYHSASPLSPLSLSLPCSCLRAGYGLDVGLLLYLACTCQVLCGGRLCVCEVTLRSACHSRTCASQEHRATAGEASGCAHVVVLRQC